MAGLNPESLIWLDYIETLRAQPANATRADLQKAVNRPNSQISVLLTLKDCLNPEDIEKIKQAAKGNQPYTLSYRSAQALASLKTKVWDLPGDFHTALDKTLSLRLTTLQIKALVERIADEEPLEDFDPQKIKPVRKAAKKKLAQGVANASPAQTEDEDDLGTNVPRKGFNPKNPRHVAEAIMLLAFMFFFFWLVWKIVVWVITWLIHLL